MPCGHHLSVIRTKYTRPSASAFHGGTPMSVVRGSYNIIEWRGRELSELLSTQVHPVEMRS